MGSKNYRFIWKAMGERVIVTQTIEGEVSHFDDLIYDPLFIDYK